MPPALRILNLRVVALAPVARRVAVHSAHVVFPSASFSIQA
jgi:hypothetical protein